MALKRSPILIIALIVFFVLPQLTFSQSGLDLGSIVDRAAENYPGSDYVPRMEWDPLFDLENYELGPGDILNLHGAGGKNLSAKLYVTSGYEIFIPLIGAINVKGLKFKDLKKVISNRLSVRYRGIQIIVAPYKLHDFKVQLRGEVNQPGSKIANPLNRLHEFLQATGGIRETGSRIEIKIINAITKTTNTVNYQNYLLKGDMDGNPYLKDGDSIVIPLQKNVVAIKGNIVHGGRFEFNQETMPLKTVVEESLGGFISTQGISGQVVITQLINNKSQTDFYPAEKFFNPKENPNYETFNLKNGDQIFFPTASVKNPGIVNDLVFVTGEVKNPTPQPYKAGVSWNAYVAAAGGVSVRANFEQIMIYKASGALISAQTNPTIEPGDTIYVPERTFKFWQDHITILMTFLSLVTTTIAISR